MTGRVGRALLCRGLELNGLASNATDLGETSSRHSHYRVRSEPCTLALGCTPSANVPIGCRARAPTRLMLVNPDSWEHDVDDLIPEATICQDEHWVVRSATLKVKLLGRSGDLSKGAANGCSAQP